MPVSAQKTVKNGMRPSGCPAYKGPFPHAPRHMPIGGGILTWPGLVCPRKRCGRDSESEKSPPSAGAIFECCSLFAAFSAFACFSQKKTSPCLQKARTCRGLGIRPALSAPSLPTWLRDRGKQRGRRPRRKRGSCRWTRHRRELQAPGWKP